MPTLRTGEEDPKTYLQGMWAICLVGFIVTKRKERRENLYIHRLSPGSLSPPICLRPSAPDALANNTFIQTIIYSRSQA